MLHEMKWKWQNLISPYFMKVRAGAPNLYKRCTGHRKFEKVLRELVLFIWNLLLTIVFQSMHILISIRLSPFDVQHFFIRFAETSRPFWSTGKNQLIVFHSTVPSKTFSPTTTLTSTSLHFLFRIKIALPIPPKPYPIPIILQFIIDFHFDTNSHIKSFAKHIVHEMLF